jgi:hypothetical protein
MTTLASQPTPSLATTTTVGRLNGTPFAWLIWLAASGIAIFFSLLVSDSTIVAGDYLPRGNDSFYHARRILDAAVGPRGFYQFDERLHAPDGAWIPWPWGYDWLMAKATQLALMLAPNVDPAAFIAYVPVAWVLVNAGLFLLCVRALGLPLEMQAVALLCFAISPLTQLLHSIGMVDHHYIEHTFVLLALWLGLRWFGKPDDSTRAVALGVALGLAPAFHNGLFLLQCLPLATVTILWLRNTVPPARSICGLVAALIATTQFVLLPSEAYRQGSFEFGLLSWFHFYAALCTTTLLGFMSWHRFSVGSLMGLVLLAVALAAPVVPQALSGAGFLTGSFSVLNLVVEVQSPYRLFTEAFGPHQTASFYSWLLLLAPGLLAWYAFALARERQPMSLYYAVAAVFGLALLLTQFRLHYFGFFVFATGWLVLLDRLRVRHGWHRGAVAVVALGSVVLAYQPALRERLFVVYAPAAEPDYAAALPIFYDLENLCRENPGVVLAHSNDGSPILFHSDCSVIANNFILRPEDQRHLDEIERLMRLSPATIRAERPDVKYLLVRAASFGVPRDTDEFDFLEEIPIARELFLADSPPPGYTLVRTIVRRADGDRGSIYARLYKIDPISTSATRGG